MSHPPEADLPQSDQHHFDCPHCGITLEATAELVGAETECPHCKVGFTVPAARQTDTLFDQPSEYPKSSAKKGSKHKGEAIAAVVGILVVGVVWMTLTKNSKTDPTGSEEDSTSAQTENVDAPESTAENHETRVKKLSFDEIKKLLLNADAGDPQAQYELGMAYSTDDAGLKKEDHSAIQWLEKAAEQGHLDAQLALGKYYTEARFYQDSDRAKMWYLKAAEQGSAEAQYQIGLLSSGSGLYPSSPEEVDWLKKAAAQGHVGSQMALGSFYGSFGSEAEHDYAEAAKWYGMAAEQSDPLGQAILASYYAEGKGVPKDDPTAAEWYLRSAENGYDDAQYKIATMYAEGRGVPKSDEDAAKWYLKSANQENRHAQFAIAHCYAEGIGVKQDFAQAAQWYRALAEIGNPEAQYKLGAFYAEGKGVPKNDSEAFKLYHLAASRDDGDINAQEALAECYEKGKGVAQNNNESIYWFQRATRTRNERLKK